MDLFQIKPQTWESTFFDQPICDIAFDDQTLCTKDINILKRFPKTRQNQKKY